MLTAIGADAAAALPELRWQAGHDLVLVRQLGRAALRQVRAAGRQAPRELQAAMPPQGTGTELEAASPADGRGTELLSAPPQVE